MDLQTVVHHHTGALQSNTQEVSPGQEVKVILDLAQSSRLPWTRSQMPTNTQRNKSHEAGKVTARQSPHRWHTGQAKTKRSGEATARGKSRVRVWLRGRSQDPGFHSQHWGEKSRQSEYRNPEATLEEGRGFKHGTQSKVPEIRGSLGKARSQRNQEMGGQWEMKGQGRGGSRYRTS